MKTQTSILKVLFLFIVSSLFYISCSRENEFNDFAPVELERTGETEMFKSVGANEKESTISKTAQSTIKIIKNATLRMEVDDVVYATRVARDYAQRYEGYISDERMTTNTYRKENRFTIRIPQTHFDTLLDSISTLSKTIETKNITTVDVTEEYIDIQSRLQTKKEVKERYESILRSKAKTVEEVLQAEEKIRTLQEEIESAEGRLRYMSNKISYSTIQIDVYQELPVIEEPIDKGPSFLTEIKESLQIGLSVLKVLVLILFRIWPILIIGTGILIYYRKRKSKRLK
ncbi:hypothetical protein GCM10011344_31810 [Dokdonia pacifica]|uniref:DUF4349 domain-containing protein n=1 Tax=Dokdonia pacifica TaxID=1627892 RepID=A0A239BLS7_9FLAO|nr:DUF4349 domain-containing protein [Dokdonia pacifica]GGG28695.1 hypothetical protein GCM10011344_31810 [Dokdonia pacifica]SNS08930.1 protein of unknown function [Dokdonia pacifica]